VLESGRIALSGSARELQDDVRRITAHPWVVVNSHHHFDHTFGNAPFMPAEIWGHERCAAAMHEGGERTKHRIAEEMPELAAELAEVTITPPTRTIADRARIDVGGRVVELRYLGRGHTDNDLAVLVPDSGVVFGGDLVEQGAPPYFGDSFPLDWPDTDRALLALVTGPVVPGHGDVVDAPFVEKQMADLAAAAEAARTAHAEGRPEKDAIAAIPFPEPFARDLLRRAYAQLDQG
jgi:glyoxylase-like metal-dependent hydrolase (beta-lactamase superfamily II)